MLSKLRSRVQLILIKCDKWVQIWCHILSKFGNITFGHVNFHRRLCQLPSSSLCSSHNPQEMSWSIPHICLHVCPKAWCQSGVIFFDTFASASSGAHGGSTKVTIVVIGGVQKRGHNRGGHGDMDFDSEQGNIASNVCIFVNAKHSCNRTSFERAVAPAWHV